MIKGLRPASTVRGRAVPVAGFVILAGLTPATLALGQAARPAAPAATPRFGQPGSPIDVGSDNSEVMQAENKVVLTGRVEIVQGQTRLRAPRVVLFYNPSSAVKGQPATPAATPGTIRRMEADGPVYFVTATQTAKGDRGLYEAETETVTLTGNVVVTQDRNVSTGDKLVIQQRTGQITMTGGPSTSGRVRGVFYSGEKPAPATQP